MTPSVSVIIVNYSVRDFLAGCLASVLRSTMEGEMEVRVVDNHSFDDSAAMVMDRFPSVGLIANAKNLGFSRAVNQGVVQSTGQYVFILNPDALVQENTIEVLRGYLERNPAVGICGPKILNADGSLQLSCKRSFPSPSVALPKLLGLSALFPGSTWAGRYNLTYLDPDRSHSVDAVSGSCMMIRRVLLDRLGMFDERFFMFGEDIDLCFRAKEAGFEVHYVADTQILHYKGESVKLAPAESLKHFYDAMNLFVDKHYSRTASLITRLGLRVGIFLRRAVAYATRRSLPVVPWIVDALVVVGSFLLAIPIRFGDYHPLGDYLPVLAIYVILWTAVGGAFGVYSARALSLRAGLASALAGFFSSVVFTYFFKQFAFSRAVLLVSAALITVAFPAWRLGAQLALSRRSRTPIRHGGIPLFSRRALIVGRSGEALRLARKIAVHPEIGLTVVGRCGPTSVGPSLASTGGAESLKSLGQLTSVREIVRAYEIRELLFTDDCAGGEMICTMDQTSDLSLTYRFSPPEQEVLLGKTTAQPLADLSLVSVENRLNRKTRRIVKRGVDLFVSTATLVFCSPAILLALVRILPVRHELCWGEGGRRVHVPVPSYTSRFLRMVLLLLPVWRGDMTLVGLRRVPVSLPNPNLPFKPGLTGLFQLRNGDPGGDRNRTLDLQYLHNQSLVFDLEIVVRRLFEL